MVIKNIIPVIIFIFSGVVFAQEYPYWFLNQKEFNSKNYVVGYSKVGFYIDSAFAAAKRDAIFNYIRNNNVTVQGGQAFWNTEAGKYIMSSRLKETFDTLKYFEYVNSFTPIDSAIIKDCVIMLMGSGDKLDDVKKNRFEFSDYEKPDWVDILPSDSIYYYDLGFSESYFYEHSSWVLAEKMGRFSIARQIKSGIQALQKMDDATGQEIQNEDFLVNITNLEICGRWKNPETKVYYVLMRLPINK